MFVPETNALGAMSMVFSRRSKISDDASSSVNFKEKVSGRDVPIRSVRGVTVIPIYPEVRLYISIIREIGTARLSKNSESAILRLDRRIQNFLKTWIPAFPPRRISRG